VGLHACKVWEILKQRRGHFVFYKPIAVEIIRKSISFIGLGPAHGNSDLGRFQNRPRARDTNQSMGPHCRAASLLERLPPACRCRRVALAPPLSWGYKNPSCAKASFPFHPFFLNSEVSHRRPSPPASRQLQQPLDDSKHIDTPRDLTNLLPQVSSLEQHCSALHTRSCHYQPSLISELFFLWCSWPARGCLMSSVLCR
jgi:hypothetical protein